MHIENRYLLDLPSEGSENRVLLIDLREKSFFEAAHLKSAVHYSVKGKKDIERLAEFIDGRKSLLYCEHGLISSYVAKELRKVSVNVGILVGGLEKFKEITPDVRRYIERNG